MSFRTIPVVVLPVLLLSACAPNKDPAQGGVLSGIGNLVSGGYEERVRERQQTLEQEQEQNTRKNQDYERALQEQQSVAADRDAAGKRYAALRKEVRVLKRQLEKAGKDNAALKGELDVLEAKIAQLHSDPVTPEPEKAKRLDSLRLQKDELARKADRVLNGESGL